MPSDRSRYGLLVSVMGATLLIVSVFLPWYGASVVDGGTGGTLSALPQAALAPYIDAAHEPVALGAGELLGQASAAHVLTYLSVFLVVLAALALLDAMLPLLRGGGSVPEGAGRAVVPLGLLAAALVFYRMIAPPTPQGGLVTLSLQLGAWLGLLGALAMAVGGMWPRTLTVIAPPDGADIFTSLSVWTSGG